MTRSHGRCSRSSERGQPDGQPRPTLCGSCSSLSSRSTGHVIEIRRRWCPWLLQALTACLSWSVSRARPGCPLCRPTLHRRYARPSPVVSPAPAAPFLTPGRRGPTRFWDRYAGVTLSRRCLPTCPAGTRSVVSVELSCGAGLPHPPRRSSRPRGCRSWLPPRALAGGVRARALFTVSDCRIALALEVIRRVRAARARLLSWCNCLIHRLCTQHRGSACRSLTGTAASPALPGREGVEGGP